MAWTSEPSLPRVQRASKFGHSTGGDSTSHLFANPQDLLLSKFVGYTRVDL